MPMFAKEKCLENRTLVLCRPPRCERSIFMPSPNWSPVRLCEQKPNDL